MNRLSVGSPKSNEVLIYPFSQAAEVEIIRARLTAESDVKFRRGETDLFLETCFRFGLLDGKSEIKMKMEIESKLIKLTNRIRFSISSVCVQYLSPTKIDH